ncbi:MAG TPA: hypothetical protein VIF62_10910 [Labilithrix sp.]
MRFRLASLALFVFAGLGLGAKGCDNDILSDPTFRLWCGDSLCDWKVEQGSVRRAPTWNEKDYGVELVDTPTAISQVVTDSPKCILFTTVADVDPSAQVTLGLDFDADGTIDAEQPIAATGFHSTQIQVSAPAYYSGIRFVIQKKGAGHAVLAQMRAQGASDCSAPPLELHDEPLGTPCDVTRTGECHSGVCCYGTCAECCDGNPAGEVVDGGIAGNPTVACADGGKCEAAAIGSRGFLLPSVPSQCDPGKHTHPSGAECLANEDCASGACDGAHIEVVDAGDTNCNGSFPDAGNGCLYGPVSGGRCR